MVVCGNSVDTSSGDSTIFFYGFMVSEVLISNTYEHNFGQSSTSDSCSGMVAVANELHIVGKSVTSGGVSMALYGKYESNSASFQTIYLLPHFTEARGITKTATNSLIATGILTAGGLDSLAILTITNTGNLDKFRSTGGLLHDRGFEVIQLQDGGFLVGGTSTSDGSGLTDLALTKYQPDLTLCVNYEVTLTQFSLAENNQALFFAKDFGFATTQFSDSINEVAIPLSTLFDLPILMVHESTACKVFSQGIF